MLQIIKKADIRSYLWLGLALTTLHLAGFGLWLSSSPSSAFHQANVPTFASLTHKKGKEPLRPSVTRKVRGTCSCLSAAKNDTVESRVLLFDYPKALLLGGMNHPWFKSTLELSKSRTLRRRCCISGATSLAPLPSLLASAKRVQAPKPRRVTR